MANIRPILSVIKNDTKVWDVLTSLGKVNINSVDKGRDSDASKGKQLARRGVTIDFKGKKTHPTSHKLTCIACHTTVPEHELPGTTDPQKRLEYADSLNIPFLPGTPFYGLVNRFAFFNNDYQELFADKTYTYIAGQRGQSLSQYLNTLIPILAKDPATITDQTELDMLQEYNGFINQRGGSLVRGDKLNDWYVFTMLTVSYNFIENGLVGHRKRRSDGVRQQVAPRRTIAHVEPSDPIEAPIVPKVLVAGDERILQAGG